MRHSILLVAVSGTALLAGCARNTEQAFKDVAPAALAKTNAPSAVAPLTQLSQEALARGDAAAAIPLAQRALESAPSSEDALLALAQAYLMSGDPAKAELGFRDTLKVNANSTVANTGLGLSLLAQQRVEEARTALRLAASQKPPVATLSNIAFALALAGAPDDAVKLLDPVALSSGSTPQLRQNLAFALVMANNRARAFEVAGYDLDGVAAARQVSAWSEISRKPFDQRLTEMAGLRVVDRPALAQASSVAQFDVKAATDVVAVAKTEAPPVVAAAPGTEATPVPVAPVAVAVAKIDMPTVVARPEHVALSVPKVQESRVFKPIVTVVPAKDAEKEIPHPVVIAVAEKPAVVTSKPVVLRPKSVAAPVVTASLNLTGNSAIPSARLPAANVSKLVGWVVQIGAVTFKTDQSRLIMHKFQAMFGKRPTAHVVVVDTPAGKLHRIVLNQSYSKTAALKTCASLKAKGRACFARTAATVQNVSLPAPAANTTPGRISGKPVKI
jgi:Flp pilus assembly protein TadD